MRTAALKREAPDVAERGWPYLILACALAILFLCFNGLPTAWIKTGMLIALVGIALTVLYLFGRKRLNSRRLLFCMMAAGVVLRVGYMLYTSYNLRGHDIGNINETGNLGYLATILMEGHLPSTNSGLFYHPPVNFILEALVVKGYALIAPGKGLTDLFEAAKLVPAFASCALLVVCHRFFRELGFSRRAMLFAMAVLSFQPTFFILSASINNDMLTIFWMAVSLLYTVKWYKNQTVGNILVLAVTIALAVTTKVSGGLVAPLAAGAFWVAWRKQREGLEKRHLPMQFGIFAAVCLPLGLWYAVRNLVLFGQSLGYVLPLSTQSTLYIGWHSLTERFFTFPVWELFTRYFCNPYGDYNLWLYLSRNALFGEFTFTTGLNFALPLLWLNLVLIALSLAAMVWVLRAKDMPLFTRFMLGGLWALQMGSFLLFNLRYPFGCTMDFRYIVPTLFSGAGFLGLAADRLRRLWPDTARWAIPTTGWLLMAYCVVSALFYIA